MKDFVYEMSILLYGGALEGSDEASIFGHPQEHGTR